MKSNRQVTRQMNMISWMTGLTHFLSPPPLAQLVQSTGGPGPSYTTSLAIRVAAPAIAAPQPELRLSLYGHVRAFVDGKVAIDEHFTRRKAKELFVLLYLERRRFIPRDELLERLWPSADNVSTDTGRLKQTALVLRRALEGGHSRRTGWQYIVERDGSYVFNSRAAYSSDLEEVDRELGLARTAWQRADEQVALEHYERAFEKRVSDLLPEFRYEDWAAPYIAAEREAYLEALEVAARLHAKRQRFASAVELLRRALREDALRETAAVQLMQWLARSGEHAEAVRVYTRLRDTLSKRLQTRPEPSTTSLYNAIRNNQPLSADLLGDTAAAS
jgi:two-component SAPR family response regulator